MSRRDERRRRVILERRKRQWEAGKARALEDGRCLLCGGRWAAAMKWEASMEVSRELGAAPGMRRIFGYLLCEECITLPDLPTLVEDKIIAKYRGHMASPCAN